MEISVGEKNEIIELYILGELRKAIRKLAILYNKDIDNVLDRNFVLKNLALINKKIEYDKINECERDFSIVNFYLKEALENIKPYKNEYLKQYYELVWLDIELNKDNWGVSETISKYTELYIYFKNIGHKRNEIGLLVNIYKLENRIEEIPNLIYEIEDFTDSETKDMIKDILQECRTFGDTYYRKALNILNQVKINNHITSL